MKHVQVGTVCGVPICVGVATDKLLTRWDNHQCLTALHLQVVGPDGSHLTQKHLEEMHLGDDDIHDFANMCREHTVVLAAEFLPVDTTDALMHPASCFIDSLDKVHVSFLLSGFVRQ